VKVRYQRSIPILLLLSPSFFSILLYIQAIFYHFLIYIMQESSIISLIAVLVTISSCVLTRLFSYLWDRCLPTMADDPENLPALVVIQQRQTELEKKLEALTLRLQQQESVSERPIAIPSSGGSIRLGAVSPGRSSLLGERNPWAV